LLVPPPPQVCGAVQVPHELTVRDVPQLSLAVTLPQFFPRREQNDAFVSGVQLVPHTLVVPPPPHVCGEVHVPQELTVRDAPQLSLAVTLPQFFPRREQNDASVSGVQLAPHTLAVPPPPHVCGDAHVPQELTVRDAPQLSLAVTLPQFFPRRVQNDTSVSGVHVPPHAPLSVHTAPQGHPDPPGAHDAYETHMRQLAFAHV
jgi:hypothetical protein